MECSRRFKVTAPKTAQPKIAYTGYEALLASFKDRKASVAIMGMGYV